MQIDLQLKYLEEKPHKTCIYHNKEAPMMCYKLSCSNYPYLCTNCTKSNIHGHQDKIGSFMEAVKDICMQIQDYERYAKDVTVEQVNLVDCSPRQNSQSIAVLERLESQIMEAIRQVKESIRSSNDHSMDRQRRPEGQNIKYYKNPNIFVKKLVSEASPNFVLKLKKTLNQRRSPNECLSSRGQHVRTLIQALKVRIQAILMNGANSFSQPNSNPTLLENKIKLLQKKVYKLPILPHHIFNFKDSMLVCGDKNSLLFDLEQKPPTALSLQYPFTLVSPFSDPRAKNSFVATYPPKSLVCYSDGFKTHTTLRQQPTSIAVFSCGELYVAVGHSDGQIQIVRINTGESVNRFKKHTYSICSVRVLMNQSVIIAASRDGKLSSYQFQNRNGFRIDFVNYAPVTMQGLLGLEIYRNDFILYNQTGNIKIFDYVISMAIMESKGKDRPIADLVVVSQPKGYLILTLAKGDKDCRLWQIERQKGLMRVQKLPCGIKHPSISYNSMFWWSQNLWILKDAQMEVSVCQLEFV